MQKGRRICSEAMRQHGDIAGKIRAKDECIEFYGKSIDIFIGNVRDKLRSLVDNIDFSQLWPLCCLCYFSGLSIWKWLDSKNKSSHRMTNPMAISAYLMVIYNYSDSSFCFLALLAIDYYYYHWWTCRIKTPTLKNTAKQTYHPRSRLKTVRSLTNQ